MVQEARRAVHAPLWSKQRVLRLEGESNPQKGIGFFPRPDLRSIKKWVMSKCHYL